MAALSLLGAGAVSAQTTAGNATMPGQTLFDANCLGCHGGTNPAIGTKNVQKATTAVALQAAITTTSPTMAANASLAALTSAQVADIAAYVASDVSTSSMASGNATNGRTVYASSCAGCHGSAPATGAARVNLGMSAAVIQNAMVKFPLAMSPTAVYSPGVSYALRFNLTPTQLNDVAAFIATDVAAGTVSVPAQRGLTIYSAMCSRCHGGSFSKAGDAAKTLSAITRNKGGMGVLGFVTTEQATEIAVSMGGGANSGGSGGGCTLGRTDQPLDPLWLLMLVGAIGVLGLRRSAQA
ncbi:MAG: c-type cytochrome [Leptothrix ochracea]|uniref:c-type cytochrome n=1 Tax=Leptothrix ochracea TaxID=735331 RepID=UPI0034E302BC